MVNHYMETISEIKLAFHWVVINIVGADVATGVTIKEFSAPKPSIETSDTYHFLLFEHAKPLDIFSKEILRSVEQNCFRGNHQSNKFLHSFEYINAINYFLLQLEIHYERR